MNKAVTLLAGSGGTATFSGVISGAQNVNISGSNLGTVVLSGANTYTGTTAMPGGTLSVSSFNSVSGGSASSSLGAPTTIANGTISFSNGTLVYTGTGETTDRVINLSSTLSTTINQSGASGLLKFTSNFTATGGGSKTLILTGSTTGTGEISGVIVNNSGTSKTSITKAGTGIWTLSATNTFSGGVTLSAGQLNINNASALGAEAGTFTISGGTIDNTSTGDITTVNYPMAWNGDFTYAGSTHNLNLGTGAVIMNASRQVTVSSSTLIAGGTNSNASFSLTKAGAGTLALNGATTLTNLTISTGSLTTTAASFNISGTWSNSGTFTPGTGTVTLNGTSQTITGSSGTTFYNLTKSVSSPATLTFPASPSITTTTSHTLTLNGASSNLLSLRSSSSPTQWKIDPQGTRTLSYIDVMDSNNTNATAIATPIGFVDSGHNTNWGAASNDATLSGLTISQGTLTPTFSSGTTSYTDNVDNATTSVTVTPTINQANATVTVNGSTVTSGSPSASIPLNVGSGNIITIVVTAQDLTTTDTYTINVTRTTTAGVSISLGKSSDGWDGAIPVYMTLTDLSNTDYPYARAKVDTPAGQTFYAGMTWSATNSRFEGTIYPGSNLCPGCADPTTGTYSVTGQLDNNSDFSSISFSSGSASFSTYITSRAYISTEDYNYPNFIPTWSTDHWHYTINNDYSIFKGFFVNSDAGTQSNVAIAIPFHPITSNISNIAVTFDNSPVSPGSATSTSNAWWWNSDTHTLYVQKASLGGGTVSLGISFDSDTDLFATRYDRDWTSHIAIRSFYNGLIVSNRYITTRIFGGGYEGSGNQVDIHGKNGNTEVGLDCMERVAVNVDDTTDNTDQSGYYPGNIKWKQDQWNNYITGENNNLITIVNDSDSTPSTGWKQQLDTKIAVQRTLSFNSQQRYIKNSYQLTNNDSITHKYPFLWGREQWIYPSENTTDQGRIAGDTTDRPIESSANISNLSHTWMTAYDTSSFAAMGMIFQKSNPVDTAYFLSNPPLANGSSEWPIHTLIPGGSNDADTFFTKTWASVPRDQSVNLTFWQWGEGDSSSWNDISTAIDIDYESLNPDTTAPTISSFSIPATSTSRTASVTFTASDDSGTVVGYCLTETNDSGTCSWSGTVPTTYTFGTDGAKTLYAFAKDATPNISTVSTATTTIDTAAPTGGAFTINSGATTTTTTAVTLNITCPTDSWTPVQMAFSNSAAPTNWTTCASFQAQTLTSGDATKTVYVRFKDGGGNTTSDYTQTITLDATAPTVSFTDNVATGPTQSDTITADWGDSSLKKWDYFAISTCPTPSSSYSKTNLVSMDQTDETNNTKYICLYAEDSLGNYATLASQNPININTPPPIVTTTHKGDNDNHKTHHKVKPKTLKQKVQQNFKSAQKWIKKQTTTFNRNLSLGSKGNDVGMLQQTLQKLGLMKMKDTTYGVYLSTTQKAVKKLQQIKNIATTGTFGWLTRGLFQ